MVNERNTGGPQMTRDDIIKLAREAGWSGLYMTYNEPTGKPDWEMVKESLTVPVTMEQIERFAELVAAAEREACAKVCEEECSDPYEDFKNYEDTHTDGWMDGCNSCAAAIRARSEK